MLNDNNKNINTDFTEPKRENLGGMTVFCSKTHRFGTDAVLLENFAVSGKLLKRACDLGTGCGIIALLMLRDCPDLSVTAVDIQPDAIELVKAAATENNLGNRLVPICSDLRTLDSTLNGSFELVTMNPPYKKAGAGLMGENEGLNIARFELKCDLDDICATAARLLKNAGRFCLCNRPERLTDTIVSMRKNGLEPKLLRQVCQRRDSAPMLFLIQGIKGASSGMTLEPNLFIEDENGYDSAEISRIYAPWAADRSKYNGKR